MFHVLWYCTGVLLVVGHIYFLSSGQGGVSSLVPSIVWCIFPLLFLIVELSGLDWGVFALCPYIPRLDPPLEVGPSDLPHLEV